jgi:hypothetical protein
MRASLSDTGLPPPAASGRLLVAFANRSAIVQNDIAGPEAGIWVRDVAKDDSNGVDARVPHDLTFVIRIQRAGVMPKSPWMVLRRQHGSASDDSGFGCNDRKCEIPATLLVRLIAGIATCETSRAGRSAFERAAGPPGQ